MFEQAKKSWCLEQLCQDLREAKQFYTNSQRKLSITQKEINCLCGLLCEYEVQEIADILQVNYPGLRTNLSNGLYRYIETLIEIKTKQTVHVTARNIPTLLEKYKKNPSEPAPGIEKRVSWRLLLENIDDSQLENLLDLLQQIPINASLKLERIEPGSVVLVFDGPQEGFERIQTLFRSGELTELLGVPVLDVQLVPTPTNLSQWLQDVFEAGWQTIEEIFSTRQLAFRNAVVKRAKQIDLGGYNRVVLVVDLPREADEEIDILLRVYPAGDSPNGDSSASRTELPENLKLILLDETGEALEEVQARKGDDCIRQPLSGSPGDRFGVKIALGNVSVSENFVI